MTTPSEPGDPPALALLAGVLVVATIILLFLGGVVIAGGLVLGLMWRAFAWAAGF